MARRSPKNETKQNRNRLRPCKALEKLHVVLIKYETKVAIKNAIPLARNGTGSIFSIKTVAIPTCNAVTNTPENAKRKTSFLKIGVNASKRIISI